MGKDKISTKIAQEFADLVHQTTGFPATVMDENAVMIGDSLKTRLGIIHPGAKAILGGECEEYFATAKQAAQSSNLKEGYNGPIIVGGEKIGVTGISGKLEVAKPLVKLTTQLIAARIVEDNHKEASPP